MPELKQPLKLVALAVAVREQVFPVLFPVLLEILLQYPHHKATTEELPQQVRQITGQEAVVEHLPLALMEHLQMAAMVEMAPRLQFRAPL